jgi:acyl carrier protein
MTHEEAVALVTGLICRIRQISPAQVPPTADLVDDLGFDSLDAAELLAALHKETGRPFDPDSAHGMRTARDIAEGIASYPGRLKVSQ